MKFDSTIGLGSIINLIVMICGGVAFLLNSEHRLTIIETNQAQLERRQADQESQMQIFRTQLGQISRFTVIPAGRPADDAR